MSDLTPLALPTTGEPVRVAVRQFRWLRGALARQIEAITAETGIDFRIDDRKLASAFVAWLRRVESQAPRAPGERRAFFTFAAGLMLQELIQKMPIAAGPAPAGADPEQPEYYWPEGFVCTVFCVNVLSAVVEQEFDATTDVVPSFFDIRSWWSFRENAAEDAGRVVGFFDLFLGEEPDWSMPTVFRAKLRRKLAGIAPPDTGKPALT